MTKVKDGPETDVFQIFVNSRPKKFAGSTITFEDVIALSGVVADAASLDLYEVAWIRGNKAGVLTRNQFVELLNGMKFDVGKSNRS